MTRVAALALLTVFVVTFHVWVAPASAYVGPGAGLSFLWALLGLIGAILLSLGVLLYLPFKILLARMRDRRKPSRGPATTGRD
jgi:hypothetical protein